MSQINDDQLERPQNVLWNIVKDPQSYRAIGYLLLTFPFGLLYFILGTIGFSLGFGLAVVGVGILILWGVFGLSAVFANLERWLSNQLLKTRLPMQESGYMNLRDRGNWEALGYLALKFPLGLMTFILTTSVIGLLGAMITAPLTYNSIDTAVVFARDIDTLWEALISSVFGLILLPFGLLLMGKVALLWRSLNLNLLDRRDAYEKRKHISREEIEQDVINRLIDSGMVDESALYEQKPKKRLYSD